MAAEKHYLPLSNHGWAPGREDCLRLVIDLIFPCHPQDKKGSILLDRLMSNDLSPLC